MRRYTAPGTYEYWQVMNIASLDSGLERERESFVLFTSLLVVKCGTWTEVQVCAVYIHTIYTSSWAICIVQVHWSTEGLHFSAFHYICFRPYVVP